MTGKKVKLEISEIEKPDLEAQLVAENIAEQIERRISHSRAMKRAVQQAMRLGAEGVKITAAGRLAGSEMARRETVMEGRVPRSTLRADIDFARAEALTTYGRIGIKVWIYKGEVLPEAKHTEGSCGARSGAQRVTVSRSAARLSGRRSRQRCGSVRAIVDSGSVKLC